jgi:DNA polymerase-3 subunit gamma/tau
MSLYLKYRPHDFDNLEWQEFIKTTLKQAIKEDKTVWAYLFCGPRWTGKTSTARILAKTINCEKSKDWNPCLTCWICKDFLENRLIDIIEIDAASHTWVDNIRDIIVKAQFSPTRTKYKVYIIDEVHMLSKWAFNALLKILEEPPEHVKFILATTEVDKVPETILSRCQRYDFKSWTSEDIKKRLLYIASLEKVEIDEKSINYIIRNSFWWFRNAISLFEQLIVDSKIDFETIVTTLWLTDLDLIENFLDKLISIDKTVIQDFEEIIASWKNTKLFFKDLIFFTKDLTIEKLKNNKNIDNLIYILDKLNDTYWKTKNSLDENTVFLIWILKIISSYDEGKHLSCLEKRPLSWILFPSQKKEDTKKTQSCLQDTLSDKFISSPNEKKATIVKKEDIVSDANDIFEIDDEKLDEKIKQKKTKYSDSLDKEKLIIWLKEIWAKASITMSLRGADFIIEWDNLIIKFKTQFALNSINNNENISLIHKWLEKLWKWNLKIKFW